MEMRLVLLVLAELIQQLKLLAVAHAQLVVVLVVLLLIVQHALAGIN